MSQQRFQHSIISLMKKRLLETLNEKKLFKLVLGLGNRHFEAIEDLVTVYAIAGADMFDINPSKEAIEAVMRGVKKSGKNVDDFYYTISMGLSGDSHIQKCSINSDKCKNCGKCAKKCPQNAIIKNDGCFEVNTEKCIGCKKCDDCKAISFTEKENNVEDIVKLAKRYKLDCIEIHLSTKKIPDEEIKYVLKNFKGALSLCLDRKFYSNERIKKLVTKVIKWKNGTDFIIQADGVPMSGGDNTFESTLQAVSMAHIVQPFGTYIFMSGGTNEKTPWLAQTCGVKYHGVSIGSYARKIVKDKHLEDAVGNAARLIQACRSEKSCA